MKEFDTKEKSEAALAELKKYWDELLSHFTVSYTHLIMYLNKHLFSKNYGMAGALSVVLFIFICLCHINYPFLLSLPVTLNTIRLKTVVRMNSTTDLSLIHILPGSSAPICAKTAAVWNFRSGGLTVSRENVRSI